MNDLRVLNVRLFGPLELESDCGSVAEPPSRPVHWRLLEYLLTTTRRDVSLEELLQTVWRGDTESPRTSAFPVRLTRLRQDLGPLENAKTSKLVLTHHNNGYFLLNPDYEPRTDVDAVTDAWRRVQQLPPEDPEGLALCAKALELYRGRLLALTPQEPWLEGLRGAYDGLFRALVAETLRRIRETGELSALPLVVRRALSVLPEDRSVQDMVSAFLGANAMWEELIGYLLALAERGLLGPWEDEGRGGPLDGPVAEDTVHVRLFGRFEMRNARGVSRENLQKTSVAWLMLKYMLFHPELEVTAGELSQSIWRGDGDSLDAGNLDSRVWRARAALAPLGLGRPDQLLRSRGVSFWLDERYTVRTDAQLFLDLMARRRELRLDDPAGLRACVDGLLLFRGPLLHYCPGAPWVEKARDAFFAEFCELVSDAFKRMEALDDFSALGLLADRASVMMPEAETFHKTLLKLMLETGRLAELRDYLNALAHVEDRAPAYICAPGVTWDSEAAGERHREGMVALEGRAKPAWLARYEEQFSEWLGKCCEVDEHDGEQQDGTKK